MGAVPNGLRSTDKYCSVCGKHITVACHKQWLYKRANPMRYQCSQRCWKIEKGLITMIKITDKYVIEIDTHFTVSECKVIQTGKRAGELTYVNQTFHYSIEDALNEVMRRLTRDKLNTDEVIEIHKVLGLLRELKAEFVEAKLPLIHIPHEARRL